MKKIIITHIKDEFEEAILCAKKLKFKLYPVYWIIPKRHFENDTFSDVFSETPYQGLKIHPRAHDWNLKNEKIRDLMDCACQFAESRKIPIFIHTGYCEFESPEKFEKWYKNYPSVTFILLHCKKTDSVKTLFERYTKEEIQASIKSIMFSGAVCGIEIYASLRNENGYHTKKMRATDKLLSSTKDKVAGFINCTYLADDAEFDTSENIADNKKEFYEISLTESYSPFAFLDDAEKRTEYYSESDRNKLSGFLFKINLNDQYFWVYQHIYSVSRIDRSKNVIALFIGDTYDEVDSDIVQIDSRADVIIFSSSAVTAKMDLMQRFFGFEQYIRAGAQKTIEIIRNLDIVDSLEKFVAFENKSKLTNAKKLLKAKNSPVLQMKKNDLLENLKKHSRYKTMFKFEEDHIVISSQKEAAAFIKMLNDDIVRSELTGKEYDSSSKMLLAPMGSSQ